MNSRSGVGIIRSTNHGPFYEPIPDRNREPSILLRIGPTNRKIRLDRDYRRWRLSGRNCFALVHSGIVSAPMTLPQNGISSSPRAGVVPSGSLAVAWCRARGNSAYFSGCRSLFDHSAAPDPSGSDARIFSSACLHFGHSNRRCSKPSGPVETPTASMRSSHRGQRGRWIGKSSGSGFFQLAIIEKNSQPPRICRSGNGLRQSNRSRK